MLVEAATIRELQSWELVTWEGDFQYRFGSGVGRAGGFEGASKFVRPEDVAEQIPCGPDLDAVVQAVKPYWEAGFTDLAIVQVGDEGQTAFLDQAARPLLDRLRRAAG
jgi:hypothetical protein